MIDVKVFSRLIEDPLISDERNSQVEQEKNREREKVKAIREYTYVQLAGVAQGPERCLPVQQVDREAAGQGR